MPKRSFPLEPNAPHRVTIEWKGMFKDIRVSFDGQLLGTMANKDELVAGREFPLPDGSILKAKFTQGVFNAALDVTRNGVPLPGSDTDPGTVVRQAGQLLYFLAALNAGLGVIAMAFDVTVLLEIGMGIGTIVTGAVYLALGFFASRGSWIPMAIAIALLWLDALALVATGTNPGGGIVVRVVFTILLVRGVKAARALAKGAASVTPPAP